jgi:hypothetical protein
LRDYLNIGLKKQRTRKKHRNLIFLSIQNKRIVKHPKNYMNGHLNETEEKNTRKVHQSEAFEPKKRLEWMFKFLWK